MIRKTVWWKLAAVAALACAPRATLAQGSRWQADHDAGWKAYRDGRLAEAETRLRAAEAEAKTFGADDPRLATTLDHLAWVYCAEGKPAAGEPLARRGLAIREKALGADHPDVAGSLKTLACLYDMEGKLPEARPLFERSLAIAEKAHGPDHPDVAAALDNLATVNHSLGKSAEAEASYKRALAIREKGDGKPIDLAPTLHNFGALELERGRYAEAEPLLTRALAIYENALGSDHPHVARCSMKMGMACSMQGQHDEAMACCNQAVEIYEKAGAGNTPGMVKALDEYAAVLRKAGRVAEAEKLEARARAVREKQAKPAS